MTGPTWRCSACDTYNAAAERTCEICGTARSVAVSGPTAPPTAPPVTGSAARSAAKSAGPTSVPKAAPKPAAERKPTSKRAELARLLEGRLPSETLVEGPDGELRAIPELARLLPHVFHPDGTFRTPGADDFLAPSPPWAGPIGDILLSEDFLARAPARPKPAPGRLRKGDEPLTSTPETTPRQEAFACGCLLLVVAAVVYGIVMLVMHWGAVIGFLGHSHYGVLDHRHRSTASASPTVTASGPCPPVLEPKLPKAEAAGARLVAVYDRTDITEEYVFCRTTAGHVYFFQREGGVGSSAAYGTAFAASAVEDGYEVDSTTTRDVFASGALTHYSKGEKKWHAPYRSEAAP